MSGAVRQIISGAIPTGPLAEELGRLRIGIALPIKLPYLAVQVGFHFPALPFEFFSGLLRTLGLQQPPLAFDDLGDHYSLAWRDLTVSDGRQDRGKGGGGLFGVSDFGQR
jgi:hypothetical protein